MSSPGIILSSYVINAVWQIALIAICGCSLARVLRRFSPQAEHVVCVLTLISAIFMPAKPVLQTLFLAHVHSPDAGGFLLFGPAAGAHLASNSDGVFALSVGTINVIAFLYVASCFYFATKFFWSLRCTAKLLHSTTPLALAPVHEQVLSKCLQAFPIRTPRIVSSLGVSGPVVLEMRGPILLVPSDFTANCAQPEFLAALAHEFGHIQRRDFVKNICYEVLSLLAAFHPGIWFIKSRIAQSREMICDEMATERVVAPATYARSLLQLASMVAIATRDVSAQPIGMFDAAILEKRIMMLNSKNFRINSLAKYGLTTLATLLVLAISVTTSNASIAIAAAQASSQAKNADESVSVAGVGRVYKVGKDVSPPVPLKTPLAHFPEAAKNAKGPFEAMVVVGLVVDSAGMPRQLKIVRTYRDDFDAEALKAVEQYRFVPGKHVGKPVATAVNIEINFKRY